MQPRDPWAVLGLAGDADLGEARRAFRRLAKRTHPDAGGDRSAFVEAVDAFRALRSRLPAAPSRRLPTPYDWVLRPEPAVVAPLPRRRPSTPPGRDFAAVLAAAVARQAA